MTRRSAKYNLLGPGLVLLLLSGLGVDTLSRPRPSEAEPYHAAIRQAVEQLPRTVGDWDGRDIPPTRAAIQLLKPNVIYNRQFINQRTGRSVNVLIVHCKDARDIDGHYPPICYPAHGMKQEAAVPTDRQVDGQTIHGIEYRFAARMFGQNDLIVDNFIVMPDGNIVRDMTAVRKQAWDHLRRFYGAAQVQVVFSDPSITTEERQDIFDAMVRAHMPAIEAIRSGALNNERE